MSDQLVFADNIVMIGDIAAAFGTPKPTIQNWMRSKGFPKPIAELKAGAVYDMEQVRAWRRQVADQLREKADAAEAGL